jgi:hypothetical protein
MTIHEWTTALIVLAIAGLLFLWGASDRKTE